MKPMIFSTVPIHIGIVISIDTTISILLEKFQKPSMHGQPSPYPYKSLNDMISLIIQLEDSMKFIRLAFFSAFLEVSLLLFFVFLVLDCLCIIGMVIDIGSDGACSHHVLLKGDAILLFSTTHD